MNKIKLGIVGYGNLGKGVEFAVSQNPDFELIAIFTRRDGGLATAGAPAVHISKIDDYKDKIDVMILCGGSASDLPEQTPFITSMFNTVDSFDTHPKIPAHFTKVNTAALENNTVSVISAGWDPGLFSMQRLLGDCVLPQGSTYTFWGKGVSQGHSDAIRRIDGVKGAIQYTIPAQEALEAVRSGSQPTLTTRQKHKRVCYVVADENADKAKIEREIVTMPAYFADYDTTVNFITAEELIKEHSGMPHGGAVIRTGVTSDKSKHKIEFNIELESNPQFTSSILLAYARATARLASEKRYGAYTVFDIPIAYLSPKTSMELMGEML